MIQIPPLGCSRRHCPPSMRTGRRGVGGGDDNDCHHRGPNPNKGGGGGVGWRGHVQGGGGETSMIT